MSEAASRRALNKRSRKVFCECAIRFAHKEHIFEKYSTGAFILVPFFQPASFLVWNILTLGSNIPPLYSLKLFFYSSLSYFINPFFILSLCTVEPIIS